MSAREIIKAIPALSDADFKLVEAALRERIERGKTAETTNAEVEHSPAPGRRMSHDEAMDHVFGEFAPVLARLAQ